jgi:hypothetical protein
MRLHVGKAEHILRRFATKLMLGQWRLATSDVQETDGADEN